MSLAGIERLLSLERVDLRDNKLTDPTEVARLTGVPYISEVYVHRNPFCKSYGNYRITIFNLFRKTPGYTEDVVIDSTGPSNSERKQLVDRAPELPGVPVVKPPLEDDSGPPVPPKVVKAIDVPEAIQRASFDRAALERGSLQRSKSSKTGSLRKKKAPKRRVVEIAQTQIEAPAVDKGAVATPPAIETLSSRPAAGVTVESVTRLEAPQDNVPASGDPSKTLPPIDTAPKTQYQPPANLTEFDVSSDLYKKKIEALRQDFGNTWLSALGEEGWDAKSVSSFPSERGVAYTSPALRPTLPRTPSQGIVSGGRTLG